MSQYNIEEIIHHFFPEPGYFLEIGCWDGENMSQTANIEREGWQGVCVDPFPQNFRGRNCKLYPYAISKDGQPREFIKVSIDRRYGGNVSYFSGFKDSLKEHWPLIENHCNYDELIINTIKFEDIYSLSNLPNYIQFLSIDTEGSELEIFESIDFNKFSFGLISFEHNGNKEVKEKIGEILLKNCYCLFKECSIDDIYISEHLRWETDKGDETLRVDYDLDDKSVVIDAGGFKGEWAKKISDKYNPLIYIFEPIKQFSEGIKEMFKDSNNILIYPYGLGAKDELKEIFVDDCRSSLFTGSGEPEVIKIKSVDFFKDLFYEIDLIKINIEGAEYELLEHIIATGFIKKVKNIQVQFHNFIFNAEARMERIQQELSKTHSLTYQYKFIWENWKRK